MKKSVCIIGGGASGIMAAIAAAQAGADVTILEHQDRIGKKILLTGNGKCNLTNMQMDISAYGVSETDSLIEKVLNQFDQNDLIKLFQELGMRTAVRRDFYVYPETEAAATVLNVLRRALDLCEVHIRTDVQINKIIKDSRFVVATDRGKLEADSLILACGGKSFPKTGADGSGFLLAKELGLKVEQTYPALTAMVCKRNGLKAVAGLRAEGEVSLFIDDRLTACDKGQIQFTDYGISGIPVFQVSSFASKALAEHKKVCVNVNLFPDLTEAEVLSAVRKQFLTFHQFSFEEAMAGFLHKKWIDHLGKQFGFHRYADAGSIPEKVIKELVKELTAMPFPVEQVKGFDFCQVTGGGVGLDQVDEHLQAVKMPGLYVIGEMLDVVGKCGGYNLQWAFSTGYIAGRHAGKQRKS